MSMAVIRAAKMAEFFQNGKIENQIADRDADTRAPFGLKDSKGQILDGKMRFGRELR